MDQLSQSLHSFLVKMAYEGISPEQEHRMEHLTALLMPDDEEALLHYYGLFGHERLSLDEIAHERKESPEQTLSGIDKSIRKLAVTPEWQMIRDNYDK